MNGYRMRCLVTGATGFIGKALCGRLLQSGWEVIACSRSGGDVSPGLGSAAIDLASASVPQETLKQCDAVVHLAGIAHQRAAAAQYIQINEQATLTLARDAAAAGVSRFVFVSSVKAMGPPAGLRPRGVDDVAEPREPYGRSKWRAENLLREAYSASPMSVAILRPALVYGESPKGNLALLARAAAAGLPRPPDVGARSMVALDDLVRLVELLLADERPGVHTYIAADGQAYSSRRIYDLLRQIEGRAVGHEWLPLSLWRLGCTLRDWLGSAHEATYDKLFGVELYSNATATSQLDWQPQLTLERALGGGGAS